MGKRQGLKEPRGCLSWGIKESFLEETEPYLKEGQKLAVWAEETAWAKSGTQSQGLWELEMILLERGRDLGCFGTCCRCCENHVHPKAGGRWPRMGSPFTAPPPHAAHSICKCPGTSCSCYRADWPSPGQHDRL